MRIVARKPSKGIKVRRVSLGRKTGHVIERSPWDLRGKNSEARLRGPIGVPTELAWAAGFFDGEGSTMFGGARRSGARHYPKISITQAGTIEKPPEVLERFRRAVGGLGSIVGPEVYDDARFKPRWVYRCHSLVFVSAVIAFLWPYLGEVKRTQAISVFERYYAQPPVLRRPGVTRGRPLNKTCKRGHDYSDAYWTGRGRNCGPCQELARQAYRQRASENGALRRLDSKAIQLLPIEVQT
jgi:hypothetical protein